MNVSVPAQGFYAAGVAPTETRQTDATTGGQKGSKLAQLGALDPMALYTVAEVAGMGTAKYSAFNFLRGYDWSLSYDAMQRHLMQWWAGEDNDSESGLPHVAHAAWHTLALLAFIIRGRGNDNRPHQVLAAAEREAVSGNPETVGTSEPCPAECICGTGGMGARADCQYDDVLDEAYVEPAAEPAKTPEPYRSIINR